MNTYANAINYTTQTIEMKLTVVFDVLPSSPGEAWQTLTRTKIATVPSMGKFNTWLAELLPESQVEGQGGMDANAAIILECDEGKVPCPMTVANWYENITPGRQPSAMYIVPVCSPY